MWITQLKQQIASIVNRHAEIQYETECIPIHMDSIDGIETTVVSFTTDVPFLSNWGKPFLIGPGSILDAHTMHEKVSKKSLEQAVDLYCEIVKRLL